MSFWELSIVIIVGLLVIGPERLPETIKTVFRWVTKAKRTMNNVRTDFEKQIGADEIRRELRNEEIMENLAKLKSVRADIEKSIEHQSTEKHEEIADGEFTEQNHDYSDEDHDVHGGYIHDEDEYNVLSNSETQDSKDSADTKSANS